ncbi:formiminotransferase N-terminal subdomain-containing protein isoform X2 [Tachysurus fulvidraco]|uniref:formiminotransferase N-terminal subdomain-containing protein isoform X2 n=2 Tax=Tachysurus fulvidraco TaxID=1234273 RepID=UPI001FEDA8F5|nr:formiminotransferase N-terminal subdomain-containing protein isoform X2 [Tachysurus fulvidraco]
MQALRRSSGMTSALGRRLVACLLNISEALDRDVVEKVAHAAITHQHGGRRKGATVLNIFSDRDYNRSVLTIVADIELIGDVVLSASKRAFSLIDMSVHEGIHPCMGAVDLVPFYPLGEEVSMEDCAKKAQAIGTALIEQVPGTSAFFFGWADRPLHRGLAHRRKELGWFRKVPNMAAVRSDIGPPPGRRYGLTGIGASHYVMNCNVTIDTQEVSLGRDVAAAIRESSPGGIPGVQVIALPHEGMVEIACNVESVPSSAAGGESWPAFIFGEQTYCHAPASLITTRVAELARSWGVRTQGTALVGFTPLECKKLAETALSQDIGHFWKELHGVHM